MRPKCKFCGQEITTEHYGITKHGSMCLVCWGRIKDEINSCTRICNNMRPDTTGRIGELYEVDNRAG